MSGGGGGGGGYGGGGGGSVIKIEDSVETAVGVGTPEKASHSRRGQCQRTESTDIR